MLYRIKQFMWAVTAVFKKRDLKYVDQFLDEKEKAYFFTLINSEQEHCLRVSKDMIASANTNKNFLDSELLEIGKLGLLHDIGKSEYALGICGKSIIVILDKISKGKLKRYDNLKKIDIYYNHAAKGVVILKELKNKYSDEFFEAVESHHKNIKSVDKTVNKKLKLLIECDGKN